MDLLPWHICCPCDQRLQDIQHSWWRHQMETFSALLALCAGNSPVNGEFPAQRPVTRSFDVFFICAWINGWINNRDAGDLRRHRAHYDVTVKVLVNYNLTWQWGWVWVSVWDWDRVWTRIVSAPTGRVQRPVGTGGTDAVGRPDVPGTRRTYDWTKGKAKSQSR